MNRKFKCLILFILSLVMAISGCLGIEYKGTGNENTGISDITDITSGGSFDNETSGNKDNGHISGEISQLTIHYLDVGQGDCILIQCGNQSMLIDAGDNSKGTLVEMYLKNQGISTLDYVIGTHPDADHIGGLDVVLYKFECKTIIMPDKTKDTATYRDVADTMKNKGYKNTLPVTGTTYKLGSASFVIVSPSKNYSDSNNCSVSILLTHGNNKFLFTGDAEEEAEQDMIGGEVSLKADVLKAGHHGSNTASTLEFLKEVKPEYVVISCGEGNSYGHPHAEVMNNLRKLGIKVFRTDEQGTLQVKSDGNTLVWNCSPSDTWQTGEASGSGRKN